ncbi:hypothetical protein IGB42_02470 [Andreprevotia sp. IGB-42]|uniref:chalcone isomerase family protein n=1 Tax=Andreprevotia sp. IGB-42 TaxID=2497473 RepID=UPI0013591CA7|nr:chalcone isomerase family protein [Andreprevotia sp. IGB-42]KAF0813070.1 hypothetical protein IGB42_02470 [Andreprevotia sp. IGB-42]
MNTARRYRAVLLGVLLLCSPIADAAGWQSVLPSPRLVGQGDFRYFGFRIYTARLWVSEGASADGSAPYALELTYHRNISRTQFVERSIDEIRRIFGRQVSDAQLARWQGYMQQAFTDVQPGAQLTGVYLPGKGCQFYSRDKQLADIADPEFAHAFFAIWLNEKTRDSDLRRQLLAGAR